MSTKSFREIFNEARQGDAYWEERAVLDFTEEIYERMEALGLTKSELAERLGTSPAYVTKILGGEANFTLRTMARLAHALGAGLSVQMSPVGAQRSPRDQAGAMDTPWRVTPEKVDAAVRRIVEVCRPRRVIVFGSHVRGTPHRHSDLDVLVVTAHEPENPRRESVRIRRALRGVGMPVDVLVVGEKTLDAVGEEPGLIYREVLRNGRVVYDAAA
ncbi:MAG: helix-turn-helix domain-containing protein [Deferrisomatales bacterium]|nr:helix-turn-helix domain-containing protein [Deferrisomatales bacterium]